MARKNAQDKALRPGQVEDKSTAAEGSITCYNPACGDYRKARPVGTVCSCRRTNAIGTKGFARKW